MWSTIESIAEQQRLTFRYAPSGVATLRSVPSSSTSVSAPLPRPHLRSCVLCALRAPIRAMVHFALRAPLTPFLLRTSFVSPLVVLFSIFFEGLFFARRFSATSPQHLFWGISSTEPPPFSSPLDSYFLLCPVSFVESLSIPLISLAFFIETYPWFSHTGVVLMPHPGQFVRVVLREF